MNRYSVQEIQSFLAQVYPGRKLLVVPDGYVATFTAVAIGTSQTAQINISAVADFVMLGMSHHLTLAAAGQTLGNKPVPIGRVLITDSGSNEQFTKQAVDLENYSENGTVDKMLPYPRVISGRSSLTVQVTNYAPAAETWGTLDLFLQGVSVRAYGD
jgi:hypothetical protein